MAVEAWPAALESGAASGTLERAARKRITALKDRNKSLNLQPSKQQTPPQTTPELGVETAHPHDSYTLPKTMAQRGGPKREHGCRRLIGKRRRRPEGQQGLRVPRRTREKREAGLQGSKRDASRTLRRGSTPLTQTARDSFSDGS